MANHNAQRLNEDIKREISAALREIKDSRVADGLVSVLRCETTNDLSFCKVYVTALNNAAEAAECLSKASGFFKKRINQRIKMRKLPELIFIPDNSLEYYEKINSIIGNLNSRDKNE